MGGVSEMLYDKHRAQCWVLTSQLKFPVNPGIESCFLYTLDSTPALFCPSIPWAQILSMTPSQASLGFPGGASSEELICQCRRLNRRRFNPWVRKILCRRKWQPVQVFLPGKFHGQRSLEGYTVHEAIKSRTRMNTHTSFTTVQWKTILKGDWVSRIGWKQLMELQESIDVPRVFKKKNPQSNIPYHIWERRGRLQ